MQGLRDGAYGLSSLSEKARKSNCLQMSLPKQGRLVMKGGKDQIYQKRCCSVFWDLPDGVQSIVFCSQIMTK